jgi:dihydrofolate synthase/folylpolyglutamate synthase
LDYHSALAYLYDLTDYEKERIARYDPDTLDLTRVKRVLALLGDPHQRFPSVHIAGTKGKGSVAATCASVLAAAGLRTGLYTSPHLHTFRERIRINGELIPQTTLAALVKECRPSFDTEPELTTFEAITALAFFYFARQEIDFGVIEVGLGGRLDATNVILPEVAVITSLSYDHTYLLGDSLAEIAREKGGIIKPGIPVVCSPQKDEALTTIREICQQRGAPLTLVGKDWTWNVTAPAETPSLEAATSLQLDGQTFELQCVAGRSPLEGVYTTPLLGRHQVNNTAVAIAALDWLRRGGIPLHPQHVHQGVANVNWPGRFEILRKQPPLVVDCAHNTDSTVKLVAALTEWFPKRRWTFILGVSKDKDVTGILRTIAPYTDRLLATQSRHARAMPAEQVAELAGEIFATAAGHNPDIVVTSDVPSALDLVLDGDASSRFLSGNNERQGYAAPGPTCITGSIFVVADARETWALYMGQELPETDEPIAEALSLGGLSTIAAGHTNS